MDSEDEEEKEVFELLQEILADQRDDAIKNRMRVLPYQRKALVAAEVVAEAHLKCSTTPAHPTTPSGARARYLPLTLVAQPSSAVSLRRTESLPTLGLKGGRSNSLPGAIARTTIPIQRSLSNGAMPGATGAAVSAGGAGGAGGAGAGDAGVVGVVGLARSSSNSSYSTRNSSSTTFGLSRTTSTTHSSSLSRVSSTLTSRPTSFPLTPTTASNHTAGSTSAGGHATRPAPAPLSEREATSAAKLLAHLAYVESHLQRRVPMAMFPRKRDEK